MSGAVEGAESAPLAGATAVVTGASSGIGRAIAIALGRAGAAVLVHARRRREFAEEVAREVRSVGSESHVLLADFADSNCWEPFVNQAWDWRQSVQIWVNNAGADVLTGEPLEWTFDQKLDYLWKVDVRGTVALSRLAGRRMVAAGKGGGDRSIINMGWDQAEKGMGGDSGEMFAATKGAVIAFTRSLAQSLAPHVRVNCLAPGWIRTAWGAQASAYWQRRAAAESLLQRWGTPEDVAAAARFLASPTAGFLTGQTIEVNGGWRRGE